jgi:hypothetical protein
VEKFHASAVFLEGQMGGSLEPRAHDMIIAVSRNLAGALVAVD